MTRTESLFHINEDGGIMLFEPRPSPSYFKEVTGDVVFAISGKLLHNYLLPRDCPRVCYYATDKTTAADKEKFIGPSAADYVINVEAGWYQKIKNTMLYCYELPVGSFTMLDECAGYYISYEPIVPLSVRTVTDVMEELLDKNVELRFTPSLIDLADAVSKSTLQFSNIRMRNARTK